ncbi:hypothetical protein [Halomonas rhizosphaerae]|uniref:Uncharacterized protein n=1 Tax=Halomonas rhizosphaerae TaxID=3043296 RepID=A0ABT6V4X6_9GAMM|nr:hypothetical protein [Halomonas rhizosphaerae]MDI5892820.1 hypothetical protein [Halomonas rhizosphaerae]
MRKIDETLAAWESSLSKSVDIGGLFSRNPVAHKWKAPFRSLSLRETVSWRTHDLLVQSLLLYDSGHLLGSRILLRSAFETVAVLIYLNQLTRKVLTGNLSFQQFSDTTSKLLLGSRDGSTSHQAINIITVIENCDKRYPGIKALYGALSESSHPNYEGASIGYSVIDKEKFVTSFSNRWASMYKANHIGSMELCITTFYHEYNEEWTDAFEKLESWVSENDDKLEVIKDRV